jgi:hypothetical protein
MTSPTVVHRTDPHDVYIGRGSRWGNPFRITSTEPRDVVIEKYRKHLLGQVDRGEVTLHDLASLGGKRLGCFCSPRACHGDVLVRASVWAQESLSNSKGQ